VVAPACGYSYSGGINRRTNVWCWTGQKSQDPYLKNSKSQKGAESVSQ
jgi:hypothetical protein